MRQPEARRSCLFAPRSGRRGFKRFLVDGESHTILLGAGVGPDFQVGVEGTFYDLEIDGIGLEAWIADFLADGPDWQDVVEPMAEE